MENIPQPQSNESEPVLTKAELDQKIEELGGRVEELTGERDGLQAELSNLLESYSRAGTNLEKFKEAKEVLEEKVEEPTLSDALLDKFRMLFGKEPKGVIQARVRQFRFREDRKYLRASVGEVAESKDKLREMIGEDLAFTGGVPEGQDKSAREESISKITEEIKNLDQQINSDCADISIKRGQALEAWKRENPEEYQKLEREKAVAEEKNNLAKQRKAEFAEFIKSNPRDYEVVKIFKNAVKNYAGTEFESEVRGFVVENLSKNFNYGEMVSDGESIAYLKSEILKMLGQRNFQKSETDGLFALSRLAETAQGKEGNIYNAAVETINRCANQSAHLDLHYKHGTDYDFGTYESRTREFGRADQYWGRSLELQKVIAHKLNCPKYFPDVFFEENKDDLVKLYQYASNIAASKGAGYVDNTQRGGRSMGSFGPDDNDYFEYKLRGQVFENINKHFGSRREFVSKIVEDGHINSIINTGNYISIVEFANRNYRRLTTKARDILADMASRTKFRDSEIRESDFKTREDVEKFLAKIKSGHDEYIPDARYRGSMSDFEEDVKARVLSRARTLLEPISRKFDNAEKKREDIKKKLTS